MKSLCLFLVLFGLANKASAQYQITQWSIDAGGGHSSGGSHSLTGSIGQPTARGATSARYKLLAGYYGIVALSPAEEGAPQLRIATGAREFILAWPATAKDFQLQEAPSLTTPAWSDVRQAAQLVGAEYQVRVPWQVGDRYFRLRKP